METFQAINIAGKNPKKSSARKPSGWTARGLILVVIWLSLSACSTNLQTKVSGNLDLLSKKQTIAILPVEVANKSQRETANMFRRTLYANLKESNFNLLEPYLVDGLLRKNGLTHPEKYLQLNPMHLGEILGADAVLISRVNKMQRAYLILHSSIEISVSLQMVDTRTGEILWRAEQTESDFQGLGKIPTGMTAAILAPIYFVTNKLNLNRLTTKMVNKLTAIIKRPDDVEEEKTFEEPVITAAARRDILRMGKAEKVKSKWAQKELEKPVRPTIALASANLFPILPMTVSAGYRPKMKAAPIISEFEIKKISVPASKMAHSAIYNKPEKEITPKKPEPEIQNISTPANKVTIFPDYLARRKTALKKPEPEFQKTLTYASRTLSSKPLKLTKKSPLLFTIQVGAYKTKAFAENMFHALLDKGYQAFITLLPSKEKTLIYRVQVEKFHNKGEALQLAKKLERKERLKNFVTSLNPG